MTNKKLAPLFALLAAAPLAIAMLAGPAQADRFLGGESPLQEPQFKSGFDIPGVTVLPGTDPMGLRHVVIEYEYGDGGRFTQHLSVDSTLLRAAHKLYQAQQQKPDNMMLSLWLQTRGAKMHNPGGPALITHFPEGDVERDYYIHGEHKRSEYTRPNGDQQVEVYEGDGELLIQQTIRGNQLVGTFTVIKNSGPAGGAHVIRETRSSDGENFDWLKQTFAVEQTLLEKIYKYRPLPKTERLLEDGARLDSLDGDPSIDLSWSTGARFQLWHRNGERYETLAPGMSEMPGVIVEFGATPLGLKP
jgi:hypothetical protein